MIVNLESFTDDELLFIEEYLRIQKEFDNLKLNSLVKYFTEQEDLFTQACKNKNISKAEEIYNDLSNRYRKFQLRNCVMFESELNEMAEWIRILNLETKDNGNNKKW